MYKGKFYEVLQKICINEILFIHFENSKIVSKLLKNSQTILEEQSYLKNIQKIFISIKIKQDFKL